MGNCRANCHWRNTSFTAKDNGSWSSSELLCCCLLTLSLVQGSQSQQGQAPGPTPSFNLLSNLSITSNLSTTSYETSNETEASPAPPTNQRNRSAITTEERWANAVFHYVRNLNCSEVLFTTQRECTHLTHLRRQRANIYVAGPSEYGRLQAFLPDGPVGQGPHNGVVVLDPYPQANFGHFVMIFFVDMDWPKQLCTHFKGKYVEENGECFTMALRTKCINSINRYLSRSHEEVLSPSRLKRRERRFAKKCEVHFLPTVKYEQSLSIEGTAQGNLLRCREDIPHFSACPITRPINETSGIVCDPLQLNHGRCETSHYLVGLDSCSLLTRCDHAVMIGGGWNHLTSLESHKQAFFDMYQFFRANGFTRKKIAPFFGNGLPQGIPLDSIGFDGTDAVPIYPAAMKSAISSRIRHLCAEPYCVETLVIYLSTPTTADGQMLLWDLNGNGIAEENEKYSIDELMRDTDSCNAISVQIIADQSFSGRIPKSIKKYHSSSHPNTIVFSSSKETEYSFNNDFTAQWTAIDHRHTCSRDVFQHIKDHRMASSTPEMGGSISLTIFGAQCDVDPQFSEYELNKYHRGCQYLPPEIILQGHSSRRKRHSVPEIVNGVISRRRLTKRHHRSEVNSRAKRKR